MRECTKTPRGTKILQNTQQKQGKSNILDKLLASPGPHREAKIHVFHRPPEADPQRPPHPTEGQGLQITARSACGMLYLCVYYAGNMKIHPKIIDWRALGPRILMKIHPKIVDFRALEPRMSSKF